MRNFNALRTMLSAVVAVCVMFAGCGRQEGQDAPSAPPAPNEARWQRAAEQNFLRAAELDPWNADYKLSLGRFYKKRGLKLRARKQFEAALTVVPGLEDAIRELEALR